MTAPPKLDEAGIDRLAELLQQRAVPFKGLNIEALDGFLTALVVSPAMVMPSEWIPEVWGGKPPRWENEDEAFQVHQLLMGHWNMCAERVRYDGADLPEHLPPLIWLPDDPEQAGEDPEKSDALAIGADWAIGFFRGVELREHDWDRWLDAHDWVEEILDALHRLAAGEAINHRDPTAPAMPVDYRERLAIIIDLPGMMADLNVLRLESLTPRTPIRREAVPGRNDACSCGSGKKYKKCCGAH